MAVRAPCCVSVCAMAKPSAPVPPLTSATRPWRTEGEKIEVEAEAEVKEEAAGEDDDEDDVNVAAID